MKRTLLGLGMLAGVYLAGVVPSAAGRPDEPEKVGRAAPPPADSNKTLAALLAALSKEVEALKKAEGRIAKLEKDASASAKKIDDLTAKLAEAGKVGPAVQKLAKALESLPAQFKTLTDRAAEQDKAIAASAVALDKQGKELAAVKKQADGHSAALDKQGKDVSAALKKQGDDNAAALAKQKAEAASALANLKAEMAAGIAKQGEANLAAMKKAGDQTAGERKRLDALEGKFAKEGADWKKLEERLARIEAILFPPPPPVVPCEIAEQGYTMMTTTRRRGCFGRLFPGTTTAWVPCPIAVPTAPCP